MLMDTLINVMKLVCFGSAVVLFVVLGRVLGMKEGDGE